MFKQKNKISCKLFWMEQNKIHGRVNLLSMHTCVPDFAVPLLPAPQHRLDSAIDYHTQQSEPHQLPWHCSDCTTYTVKLCLNRDYEPSILVLQWTKPPMRGLNSSPRLHIEHRQNENKTPNSTLTKMIKLILALVQLTASVRSNTEIQLL